HGAAMLRPGGAEGKRCARPLRRRRATPYADCDGVTVPSEEAGMSGEATTLTRKSAMKVTVSTAKDPRYIKGRREFFKYRELGVTEGTGGRMRAQVTSASQGLSRPTGWHRHVCEMQLVYMLSGWLELDF